MPLESWEERMHQFRVQQCRHQIWYLERRCFNLEQAWSRLERRWPGSTPEEQTRLRRRKAELQHETRMIRIELEILRRQAEPLMSTPTR